MPQPPSYLPDFLADPSLTREQREAMQAMRTEMERMQKQMQELEKRLDDAEHKSPDEPAMILTRPEFNREVARMLAFDERYGGTSSVLYFDFENLEAITIKHGKAIANAAIREITDTLVKSIRSSDIAGRLAPDEFGALLVRCSNADAWKKGKELAALLLARLTEIQGCTLDPQISYGAYTFKEDSKDVAAGIKEASELMTKITVKR